MEEARYTFQAVRFMKEIFHMEFFMDEDDMYILIIQSTKVNGSLARKKASARLSGPMDALTKEFLKMI